MRTVRVIQPTRAALVLGSTQPSPPVPGDVDVVRRRSGGGAVLVEPGGLVWVDVLVPAADPLWEADVGRAFAWLGRAWAEALGDAGVAGAVVHEGPLLRSRWSAAVCFAGLGPGEVTTGGAKVVGMAQRRTKAGALFQCAAVLRWDPGRLVELLDLPRQAATELAGAACAVPVDAAALVTALVARLP